MDDEYITKDDIQGLFLIKENVLNELLARPDFPEAKRGKYIKDDVVNYWNNKYVKEHLDHEQEIKKKENKLPISI